MPETAEIVKSGTWLYGKKILHEIWIVRQNFDYHYDEGYEDTTEKLNPEGVLYQLVHAKDGAVLSVGPASESLEEATDKAEVTVGQTIDWDDHRIQPLFNGRRYTLSP